MKENENSETFFPNLSELEEVEQWFPHQPVKSPSRLSIFIALLDEFFLIAVIIFTIYMIYQRFD